MLIMCVNKLGELFKPDYITVLLNLGYQMKDIQKYLGHADFSTTAKTYAHVDFSRKNDMSNRIDGVLKF